MKTFAGLPYIKKEARLLIKIELHNAAPGQWEKWSLERSRQGFTDSE
jgi:hypothetical protein